MLEQNLKNIQKRMRQAIQKTNYPKNVILIAVTKSVSVEVAKQLLPLGVYHFGENRVEKLLEKKQVIQDDKVVWHLIGNLQTRKVKEIINEIDYFHALDRKKTAMEIQKRANKQIKCFVEVNVSGEETKQGITLEETLPFIEMLKDFDKIQVVGLMTMAPYDATEDNIRDYFRTLAIKQQEIANLKMPHAPCTELSMGMSNDFEIAIEEGASYVRIGTSLFEKNCEEGM